MQKTFLRLIFALSFISAPIFANARSTCAIQLNHVPVFNYEKAYDYAVRLDETVYQSRDKGPIKIMAADMTSLIEPLAQLVEAGEGILASSHGDFEVKRATGGQTFQIFSIQRGVVTHPLPLNSALGIRAELSREFLGAVHVEFLNKESNHIGCAVVKFAPDGSVDFSGIVVDDAYQGQGIGAFAVRALAATMPTGTKLRVASSNEETNDVFKIILKEIQAEAKLTSKADIDRELLRRARLRITTSAVKIPWLSLLEKNNWTVDDIDSPPNPDTQQFIFMSHKRP